jgi:hypothetical protein
MAYRFEADERVPDAIRRCAGERLNHAVSVLTERTGHDPVGAVQAAGKAVEKERSLLGLARGAMPSKQRRRDDRALAAAARGLSDALDAEVMVETIDLVAGRYVGQLPESTFQAIREQLALTRDRERARLAGSALDTRVGQELVAVRSRVDDWTLTRGGWGAIEPGLLRSYRRGRQALARSRREPSLQDLHAWRERVRDLWHQERLLTSICGPTVRGHAKDASRLAGLLGDDHALGVLRQVLTQEHVDVAVDLDAVVRLIDHRRSELHTEAIHVGERVYTETPKAFSRRMKGCWKAGRAGARASLAQRPAELAQTTRETHVD